MLKYTTIQTLVKLLSHMWERVCPEQRTFPQFDESASELLSRCDLCLEPQRHGRVSPAEETVRDVERSP